MKTSRFKEAYDKVGDADDVVVVGAGTYGRNLAIELIGYGKKILCFFDNNKEMIGKEIDGIQVQGFQKITKRNVKYIISVVDDMNKYSIYQQLRGLGIKDGSILFLFSRKDSLNRISFRRVLKKVGQHDVAIFGTDEYAIRLFHELRCRKVAVRAFFKEKADYEMHMIEDIEVEMPHLLDGKMKYIICAIGEENRRKCIADFTEHGIIEEEMIIYHPIKEYSYFAELDEEDYKEEISERFYEIYGKELNWDNPKTYNEKINCEKISKLGREKKIKLADKVLVRDWVIQKMGNDNILTRLLAVWDDIDEIDLSLLPKSFVIKLNNGSGRNIVVKDKNKLDIDELKRKLALWNSKNYAYTNMELQYKNIPVKILAEEYLDGVADCVREYQFFCFHGEPKYIWCVNGSHKPDCKAAFYDVDWHKQDFSFGYPLDESLAPVPKHLEEMIAISKNLSSEFDHVRIDLYDMPDGRILFGEVTFSTWGGYSIFLSGNNR